VKEIRNFAPSFRKLQKALQIFLLIKTRLAMLMNT
jgi:hypothetical protein